MNSQANVIKKKESVLVEIVSKMPICERFLVQQYLENANMAYEERERIRNLEVAMNREPYSWWNSIYPQERAYRQFHCSTLIMNFDIYKQDMQRLLCRHVDESELFDRQKIMKEVSEKYNAWFKKNK